MHNRLADHNGGATEMKKMMTSTDPALIIWQRPNEQTDYEPCQIMSVEDYDCLVVEAMVLAKTHPTEGKIEVADDGRQWWIPISQGS